MHYVTLMPLLIVITVEAAATVLLNLLFSICQTLVKEIPTIRYLQQKIKAEFIAYHARENYVRSSL